MGSTTLSESEPGLSGMGSPVSPALPSSAWRREHLSFPPLKSDKADNYAGKQLARLYGNWYRFLCRILDLVKKIIKKLLDNESAWQRTKISRLHNMFRDWMRFLSGMKTKRATHLFCLDTAARARPLSRFSPRFVAKHQAPNVDVSYHGKRLP